MSTHKLDRLFNEKLSNHEMTPSSEAWELLNERLTHRKNNKTYLKYAAAIILLISVSVILVIPSFYDRNWDSYATIIVDKPTQEQFNFKWNLKDGEKNSIAITSSQQQIAVVSDQRNTEKEYSQPETFQSSETRKDVIAKTETFELESISILSVDIQNISLNDQIEPFTIKQPTVKIKYIAENDNNKEDKKLKKIINYARANSPVDMLADIRNAKDQFISEKISLD